MFVMKTAGKKANHHNWVWHLPDSTRAVVHLRKNLNNLVNNSNRFSSLVKDLTIMVCLPRLDSKMFCTLDVELLNSKTEICDVVMLKIHANLVEGDLI